MSKNKQSRRRAGVGWFLCLCVACSTLWNCAGPDPYTAEEMAMASRAYISDDEIDIEVIWRHYDSRVAGALDALERFEMGRKLLKEVKNTGIPITFEILLDNEGNLVKDQEWGYKGGGVIGYSYSSLVLPNLDELMFHEMFHVVQTGRSALKKSLNNEVEAYLAQYLYAKSKGGQGGMIDDPLGVCIRVMASCFDGETGGFKFEDGAKEKVFDGAYMAALMILENEPKYAGYEKSAEQSFATLCKIFGKQ